MATTNQTPKLPTSPLEIFQHIEAIFDTARNPGSTVAHSITLSHSSSSQVQVPEINLVNPTIYNYCNCRCGRKGKCFCSTELCHLTQSTENSANIISNYAINVDYHQETVSLILKLHTQSHSNFRKIIGSFKKGDYNSHPDVVNHPHIEAIRSHIHKLNPKNFNCLSCITAKMAASKKSSNESADTYTHAPFEKLSFDVIGPVRVPGTGGVKYALIFIDQRSRYIFVDFTTHVKASNFIPPVTSIKLQIDETGWKLRKLYMDSASQNRAKEFVDFLLTIGILTFIHPGGQHWRNGDIERAIRTILEMTSTFLTASHLPIKYWPHAMQYSVFAYNHQLSKKSQNDPKYQSQTPAEIIGVHTKHTIPVFGQLVIATAHSTADRRAVNASETTKYFNLKGLHCAFLNFEYSLLEPTKPTAVLLNLSSGSILRSNDYTVIPNRYAYNLKQIHPHSQHVLAGDLPPIPQSDSTAPNASLPNNFFPIQENMLPDTAFEDATDADMFNNSYTSPEYVLTTILQLIKMPTYNDTLQMHTVQAPVKVHVMNISVTHPQLTGPAYSRILTTVEHSALQKASSLPTEFLRNESIKEAISSRQYTLVGNHLEPLPLSLKEALSPPFVDKWEGPVNAEIQGNFIKNNVLNRQPFLKENLPADAVILRLVFVPKIKTGAGNVLLKRKARLPATGFLQKYSIHYRETYAPTCCPESFRMVMYKIAVMGWNPFQFDITTAFLMADLDRKNIFIKVQPGFPEYKHGVLQFYQLLKAIYGLKQAAMLWHKIFGRVFTMLGYTATITDVCQYFHISAAGLQTELVIWVDDLIGASMDPHEGNRIADAFHQQGWEFTRDNRLQKILGMFIGQTSAGNPVLYNDQYIEDLIRQLGLQNLKIRQTPGPENTYFVPNDKQLASLELHNKYRKGVGSCNWMVCQWRPDISFYTGHLSRFLNNPSVEHFDALIWLIGYLKGTTRYGIYFQKPRIITQHVPHLLLRCDSNWGGDHDGRSTSSYLVSMHHPSEIEHGYKTGIWPHGNLIGWSSKRQTVTHTSSEGSESQCLVDGIKCVLALRNQVAENKLQITIPTPALIDNSSTIINCHDGKVSKRNKHHAIQLGFLKDHHGTTVEAIKINGSDNTADLGTKPTSVKVFKLLQPNIVQEAIKQEEKYR